MSGPRILAIMGSGETAPTMAKVHRSLFERFGGEPVPAAILDTPYGFQENADELSARTVRFFRENVGRDVAVASFRSRDVDPVTAATAVARIRQARYLMAGPGSPSYALRQWAGGPIPAALADGLRGGGVLTMASAAAVTLGVVAIPVYEIYKVGAEPTWLPGLDLLGPATGLRAAVVPHYDNAEGGNHDTRFCYMGERRLRILERQLPPGVSILGVDGHTALILDLDEGTAAIAGLGAATVRVDGRSAVFPSGTTVTIEALADAARTLAEGGAVNAQADARAAGGSARSGPHSGGAAPVSEPLQDKMADLEGTFIDALGGGDRRTAVAALLDLDAAIEGRIRAGEDSPDLDNARSTFRAMIVRLGEAASVGTDRRSQLGPLVEALLGIRARARAARDWETADLIRDRLMSAGVEIRDDAGESSWVLTDAAGN